MYVFDLDAEVEIKPQLILDIHKIAFSELYEWAGFWRTTTVTVGQLTPPEPNKVLHLIYQFVDHLNFKIKHASNKEEHIECLVYAHYEFVRIHPFNNGNGRTGRLLMNLVALKLGYKPLELYHRQGNDRRQYIDAMQLADKGDYTLLGNLIRKELTPF